MKHWKIRDKMISIIMICFVFTMIGSGIDLYNEYGVNKKSLNILESNIRGNYDDYLMSQVDAVISLIEQLHVEDVQHNIKDEITKNRIASVIREIRYKEDGYFWIDTSDGENVVLYGSDVEGTNRYNFQDSNGNLVVQEVIEKAMNGGGFTDYSFPRMDESQPVPKRAYSKYYEPFDWIIGTGVYTDGIDMIITAKTEEQSVLMKEHMMFHFGFFITLFMFIIIINTIIIRKLVKPIVFACDYAENISNNSYILNIPDEYIQRKDEIGSLLSSLQKMYFSIVEALKEKESVNTKLYQEKEFLNIVLSSIKDGIIATDVNGIIKMTNKAAIQQLELESENTKEHYLTEILGFLDKNENEIINTNIRELHLQFKGIVRRECLMKINQRNIFVEDSLFAIYDNSNNIEGYVYIFRDINERMIHNKQVEYLNYHDQLTGLYNRRHFEEECDRLLAEQKYPLTLIIADLNALKLTNDAFGHIVGDNLITKFAEVLQTYFGSNGTVARIGGDEFAVLCPEVNSKIVENTITEIKKELKTKKINSLPISAAFGYAVHTSETFLFSETFKKADDRMYEMKILENEEVKKEILRSVIQYYFAKYPEKKKEVLGVMSCIRRLMKVHQLSKDKIAKLKKSALVYDIGNITIQSEYLNKNSELNMQERSVVRTHPAAAYHILKNVNHYSEVADIVLAHHENFDGSGYPKGLQGEQIPYEARILAIVTDYYAMTSPRKYRQALPKERAISELVALSGVRYDPDLLQILIQVL